MSSSLDNKEQHGRSKALPIHVIPAPILPKRDEETKQQKKISNVVGAVDGHDVNASGHEDQLQRHFGLLSLVGLALTVDQAWIAFGGGIVIASANGGPSGVLYELLTGVLYYAFIAVCIAEFASSVPSAGGVYHWATITGGPRYGRALGFFTGAINFAGWIFSTSAGCQIVANIAVQTYVVFHPDLEIQSWQTYVVFVCNAWFCVLVCIFFNRFMPFLQEFCMFLVLAGVFITIIIVAVMPQAHANNDFVWRDWNNVTGWSDGVAFLTGVLNGAFTIGTLDAITHCAEEIPQPKKHLPKAIFLQLGLGGLTSFLFGIAAFYGVSDFDAVLSSNGLFPLAEIYAQATNRSTGATFGLLFIVFISNWLALPSIFLATSRIWWTLARDNATPFPATFSKVDERLSCPVWACVFCGFFITGIGAITLGSKTAFNDIAGCAVILTTFSYVMAIVPHILNGRKNMPPGPFWLGKYGMPLQIFTVLLICFFDVMFCLPYGLPTTVSTMNYNSVVFVGVLFLTGIWWLIHGTRKYPGPKVTVLYLEKDR